MLIEAPFKTGDTVSLKLTSGEEVVGRFDTSADGKITLIKPLMMVVQQHGIGLGPFMFSVSPETKFQFRETAVSCMAKTETEIAKQYTQSTTGIALP